MTEEELQAVLEKSTPERDRYELFVEECQDQDVRLRFSLKAGEDWSSAALLAAGPHLAARRGGRRTPR